MVFLNLKQNQVALGYKICRTGSSNGKPRCREQSEEQEVSTSPNITAPTEQLSRNAMVNVELETRMHRNIVEGTNKWSDVSEVFRSLQEKHPISVVEAKRGRGLPDDCVLWSDKPTSSAQIKNFQFYMHIGNAVPVPLAAALERSLGAARQKDWLEGAVKRS
ncbi:hypothetical protein B0H14DRAFT_2620847 [Mycena olivaceomarginata]|nr:hypothetical protein B0H14DRAFT_2620847 [Mycena olivaceomarginata]